MSKKFDGQLTSRFESLQRAIDKKQPAGVIANRARACLNLRPGEDWLFKALGTPQRRRMLRSALSAHSAGNAGQPKKPSESGS